MNAASGTFRSIALLILFGATLDVWHVAAESWPLEATIPAGNDVAERAGKLERVYVYGRLGMAGIDVSDVFASVRLVASPRSCRRLFCTDRKIGKAREEAVAAVVSEFPHAVVVDRPLRAGDFLIGSFWIGTTRDILRLSRRDP